MENQTKASFELIEIEDVRIILKVKGKHYSILSAGDKEEGKLYRISLVQALLSNGRASGRNSSTRRY